jgi:hypothetical protein
LKLYYGKRKNVGAWANYNPKIFGGLFEWGSLASRVFLPSQTLWFETKFYGSNKVIATIVRTINSWLGEEWGGAENSCVQWGK